MSRGDRLTWWVLLVCGVAGAVTWAWQLWLGQDEGSTSEHVWRWVGLVATSLMALHAVRQLVGARAAEDV